MKNHFTAIIFSLAIIISVVVLATTYKNRQRSNDLISVTGLGNKDFTSDLIVWNGSFARRSRDMKEAFDLLKKDREEIKKFLTSKGVKENEIVFSSVNIDKEYEEIFSKGTYTSSREFIGYALSQNVEIESKEVDKIEGISREITELINMGVEFYSQAPQYHYTKLAELKIQMVAEATKDGRVRAEKIAENSGSEIGDLRYASMGIFQITAQNSNEDYSWGGTFNLSSKRKTASITMKLQFGIE